MTGLSDSDDHDFDYDPSSIVKLSGGLNPAKALETAGHLLKVISNRTVMDGLESVLRESYKFIRLTDDLHDIKFYLSDIRLCFVALTISGYVGVLLYFLVLCFKGRNRGAAPRRRNGGDGHGSSLDEEIKYGWKAPDELTPYGKAAMTKTTYDVHSNRYTTRSLNRNFQPNFHEPKLDSVVVDSPSKKRPLLENHHSRSQQQIVAVPEQANPASPTWENGDVGNIAPRMAHN